ncbi:uncharacterized protein LOC9644222 [Selaginella moellendorffii]|uniref:uncharacterized protein LOC9644222 n=1 Tax=Selaginella moellendorffii TaxID=88036 RepID=UPI000D1C9420|nr:uncharacterized protein LOC9644222 [Selaginella moellendorffii]|eukprot:XP_024544745.1 uncharacterized protein LOC9644222 [Selaginella moellendorffii]
MPSPDLPRINMLVAWRWATDSSSIAPKPNLLQQVEGIGSHLIVTKICDQTAAVTAVAFDANQHLIRVACIDITTEKLISKLSRAVVQEEVSTRSFHSLENVKPLPLTQPENLSLTLPAVGGIAGICVGVAVLAFAVVFLFERMEDYLLLRSTFLLVLSLLLANAQDNIETVLDETDFQVQAIANQAILNRASTCGSLADCSLNTCTRRPCWPQSKDEIQKLSCFGVFHNGDCTSQANGTCQSLSVSSQRTYLRVPPDAPEKDRDFQTVLCAQKSLDKKLQQAWDNTRKFSLGWAFFGGIEGYLYVYPGRDYVDSWQCDIYDPRLRPWFLNALAVQKSLYILLETSTSMSNPTGVLSSQTRFNVANNIIKKLLNTLTNGDQVAVSTIGGEKIGAPVSVVLGVQETSLDLAGISSLKDSISNTSVTNSASNIKNGLQAALDFFNTSSNLNCLSTESGPSQPTMPLSSKCRAAST